MQQPAPAWARARACVFCRSSRCLSAVQCRCEIVLASKDAPLGCRQVPAKRGLRFLRERPSLASKMYLFDFVDAGSGTQRQAQTLLRGWSDGIGFVLSRNREFNESGSPQPPPSWEFRERGNLASDLPSVKYAFSGLPLRFSNGRTAIDFAGNSVNLLCLVVAV